MRRFALRIAQPCPKRWSELSPAEGGRSCSTCERHVVDVEASTSDELAALVDSGELGCVRIATLADGSVLTRDHPRSPRFTGRRAGSLAAAAATAALGCAADAPIEAPEAPLEVQGEHAQAQPPESALEALSEDELEMLRSLGYGSDFTDLECDD